MKRSPRTTAAVKLDRSRLLGFDQIQGVSAPPPGAKVGSKGGSPRLSAKVGSKTETSRLGAKVGSKTTSPRLGAKVGSKDV